MSRMTAILCLVALLVASVAVAQTFGVKKRTPKPHEYGTVIIDNNSHLERMAAVEFPHWLHRAKYTCRLCHVDLGFAMITGETGIVEDDNRNGLYCGACHDGETAFDVRDKAACVTCHSVDEDVEFKYDFYQFTREFPRARFGNRVDWMIAEEDDLISLIDAIEGITILRKPLTNPGDKEIRTVEFEMPDVIFSHDRHTVWNGCELCHPQIFGVKRGRTPYEMQDIFDGRFCGACHGKVAFPNSDCQLCHTAELE